LQLRVFRSLGGSVQRFFQGVLFSFLFPVALFAILLPVSVLFFVGSLLTLVIVGDPHAVFLLIVSGGVLALFARLNRLVPSGKDIRVHELVVDRSGLTIQRTRMRNHIPWQNIAQIGVLQPERRSFNQRTTAARYERKPLLVVRIRPDAPAPDIVSILSDEHLQLGYLGLCMLGDVRSSRQEMNNALERFAGSKLVHNSRQFLDRDSRLRPDMV